MNRQIILFKCIILIGGMAIILPSFFSSHLKRKEAEKIKILEEKHIAFIDNIGSSLETIEEPELLDEEIEFDIYNESQMYFSGIESLYDYLKFNQVEDVKEKLQFFIHQNISKNVLDCYVKRDTIREENNYLFFNIEIKNDKSFDVEIKKDDEDNIIDFSISFSIEG